LHGLSIAKPGAGVIKAFAAAARRLRLASALAFPPDDRARDALLLRRIVVKQTNFYLANTTLFVQKRFLCGSLAARCILMPDHAFVGVFRLAS
jgi:hypothetical protein